MALLSLYTVKNESFIRCPITTTLNKPISNSKVFYIDDKIQKIYDKISSVLDSVSLIPDLDDLKWYQRYNLNKLYDFFRHIWRPPSLSELTPMIFNTGLTHLGSEASIYSSVDLK